MNYENLKKACEAKGLTLTKYLENKGMNTGNTGKWKGGGNPSVPVLVAMSIDLGVSTDYLLGLTDEPYMRDENVTFLRVAGRPGEPNAQPGIEVITGEEAKDLRDRIEKARPGKVTREEDA